MKSRRMATGPAKGIMRLRSYTSCAAAECIQDIYLPMVSGLPDAVEQIEGFGWEYTGASGGWICGSCANAAAKGRE